MFGLALNMLKLDSSSVVNKQTNIFFNPPFLSETKVVDKLLKLNII